MPLTRLLFFANALATVAGVMAFVEERMPISVPAGNGAFVFIVVIPDVLLAMPVQPLHLTVIELVPLKMLIDMAEITLTETPMVLDS